MAKPPKQETQIDKFKEAAREAGTDDDEQRFDDKLKRVAQRSRPDQPAKKS